MSPAALLHSASAMDFDAKQRAFVLGLIQDNDALRGQIEHLTDVLRPPLPSKLDGYFTRMQARMLSALIGCAGKCATKQRLYEAMYFDLPDADWPEQKIIDVQICKTRQRLRAIAPDVAIETVWGRGYLISKEHAASLSSLGDLLEAA